MNELYSLKLLFSRSRDNSALKMPKGDDNQLNSAIQTVSFKIM